MVLATASPMAFATQASTAPTGLVTTVAGPGFCRDTTVIDPASLSVRGLAVDTDGTVHAEVGRPGVGQIATIREDGSSILTPTGVLQDGGSVGRIAIDGTGGTLVADGTRIVQFAPGLRTVAGAATGPSSAAAVPGAGLGDGGPASEARFRAVRAITTDEEFNLYIVDETAARPATLRIRLINRTDRPVTFYPGTPDELTVAPGHIDTIAGADVPAGSGDGGPARAAGFAATLPAIAVAGGRLYLASSGAEGDAPTQTRVRVVNLGGAPIEAHGVTVPPATVATVAGGGPGTSGLGEADARASALGPIPGISASADGNLYLAEEGRHRVLRVDPAGKITMFAGTEASGVPAGGFNGNDRPATTARLNRPVDVKVGTAGRAFVSDSGNGQIRVVERSGLIRAAFGNGLARAGSCPNTEFTMSGRGADVTRQGGPAAVAVDPSTGEAYAALSFLGRVVRLDASGRVTTVAGGGTSPRCPPAGCPTAAGDGGPAIDVVLREPAALAFGPNDILYVLDRADSRVRAVNLGSSRRSVNGVTISAGDVATVVGTGHAGTAGDGNPARTAELSFGSPATWAARRHSHGLAADTKGNLYVADGTRVRMVDPDGTISTIAPAPGVDCCNTPAGMAAVGDRLYVADAASGRVWLLNRGRSALVAQGQAVPPGEARVVAGNGDIGFEGDGGPALAAQLSGFAGLAVDGPGNLYLANPSFRGNSSMRRVDPSGVITTVAGGNGRVFNGDGLPGPLTGLALPAGVAVDRCGNLLMADQGADRVRRLDLGGECEVADGGGGRQPTTGASRVAVVLFVTFASIAAVVVLVMRARRAHRPGTGSSPS